MTHLLDPWPRCPACGAVVHPNYPHLTEHRPGCPLTHTDPQEWSTTR